MIRYFAIFLLLTGSSAAMAEESAWGKAREGSRQILSGIEQGSREVLGGVREETKKAWAGSHDEREAIKEGSKGVWQSVKDFFGSAPD